MSLKYFTTIIILCLSVGWLHATDYHVSKAGSNYNDGSKTAPFKTISKAAKVAVAGDLIIVHEGTYREWVSPENPGLNDSQRITYEAAENEEVWIKGSEVINTWKKYKNNVWTVTLDNAMFGNFNPYQEIIEGDWVTNTFGRDHHLGEVYLNGKALYEIDSLEKVLLENPSARAADKEGSKYKWYCQSNEKTTSIYANFKGLNPNKELVEINVRPLVFFPEKTGVNYITVRGFKMCHAATQWAPPTAEQLGLIGPHWSKGWIIEDNLITDSKCSGISIGKEKGSGHNEWTNLKVKHGTQRERDVIFKALQMGWSRETVGSHIIRNNTIRDCEQTGICGHLGGVFSQIYNNHIYNIHVKDQFSGAEIAGIKLHAAIDVLIEGNCIHDNFRGLWLDWQAQGTRVKGNLFFNNKDQDCFVEVSHGPTLFDNNIMLSDNSFLNASQGIAFVHNLFAGNLAMRYATGRYTPYHFPHSTSVAGLVGILNGDDRFYNNIFASNIEARGDRRYTGTNAYNEFPLSTDMWYAGKSPLDFSAHKLPVYIASNLYFNLAQAFNRETDYLENRSLNPNISIEQVGNAFYLNITMDDSFEKMTTPLVTSQLLGAAFESEASFENNDGSPITVDADYFGTKRRIENPIVGPIESLHQGKNRIKVFGE
jgi:alpha-L-arabinofuranosidase